MQLYISNCADINRIVSTAKRVAIYVDCAIWVCVNTSCDINVHMKGASGCYALELYRKEHVDTFSSTISTSILLSKFLCTTKHVRWQLQDVIDIYLVGGYNKLAIYMRLYTPAQSLLWITGSIKYRFFEWCVNQILPYFDVPFHCIGTWYYRWCFCCFVCKVKWLSQTSQSDNI